MVLNLQIGNYLNNLFYLETIKKNNSVNHIFFGNHTEVWFFWVSQINNRS